ncbi:UNVERIFIED_CONTAM: hypothetical protein O8I53_11705 [Campylobacter lari]
MLTRAKVVSTKFGIGYYVNEEFKDNPRAINRLTVLPLYQDT